MKKTLLAAAILPLTLAGCMTSGQGSDSSAFLDVNEKNMIHHHWVLENVDGKALELPEGFSAPDLEIGEKFTANGHGGCNRYFGQAELKDNQFRIENMASTMMACPEPAMKLEDIMSNVLGDWSDVTLSKQTLTLKNDEHTLRFQLRDWVN